MTRAHFELIAYTIKNLPADATKDQIAYEFANALLDTNESFQKARFVVACGAHDVDKTIVLS
jgi:hypothetical protein